MQVEAIGAPLGESAAALSEQNRLSQNDFIKLFLAQLSFQDPLEPVDNAQFLAQLAQFSAVEQSSQMNSKLDSLLSFNSIDQAVYLIGRRVQLVDVDGSNPGIVRAVEFTDSGPSLTVEIANQEFIRDVRITQIKVITGE